MLILLIYVVIWWIYIMYWCDVELWWWCLVYGENYVWEGCFFFIRDIRINSKIVYLFFVLFF